MIEIHTMVPENLAATGAIVTPQMHIRYMYKSKIGGNEICSYAVVSEVGPVALSTCFVDGFCSPGIESSFRNIIINRRDFPALDIFASDRLEACPFAGYFIYTFYLYLQSHSPSIRIFHLGAQNYRIRRFCRAFVDNLSNTDFRTVRFVSLFQVGWWTKGGVAWIE